MNITVEVSLYPLTDKFLPVISEVVERLNRAQGVSVKTNAMSTQITGEFGVVMDLVKTQVHSVFADQDNAVFVCKFLNGAQDLDWQF